MNRIPEEAPALDDVSDGDLEAGEDVDAEHDVDISQFVDEEED